MPTADEAEALRLAAQARLAAIIESSDDAIVSKLLDGTIQTWNKGAERIFGWKAEEVIGKPITIIIPADRQHEEPKILERLRSGERVDHFETIRITKDGRLLQVSVTISPVRDATGRIVGASKVARDITVIKQIEQEKNQLLERERSARIEAERNSVMKDEFLATLSHELRTPLNAILGYAQMLRAGSIPAEELSEAFEIIERNARTQTQIIEDLLDLSRIVAGKVRLDVQRVDLADAVRTALDTVKPTAEAKGVRIINVLDPHVGPVRGDPARIQQIVWNLLTNAIKFTPRGGKVQVALERVNSHVEIVVSDTGQGITPEFLPFVFDRFRQADASTTRKHGGLGVGLAIVKQLVELHGGNVRAKSPGPGQGATFIVALPLSAATDEHVSSEAHHHPKSSAAAPAMPHEIDLLGVRVLVVDDDLDARQLISRILQTCHADVAAAASATEALEMIRQNPPNVLISDLGLPEHDGYELMQWVRALPESEGSRMPAVALSAFARSEDRRRAMLAGFQMHVAKPVEPAELIAIVASLAGRVGR